MKNFPHQFNDLTKLFNSLELAKELIDNDIALTDDNFGEKLTQKGIYTYRDNALSIDDFLAQEKLKPAASRGYLTVSRDIRRFFELLGFIVVYPDKKGKLTTKAKSLLQETDDEEKRIIWKNAMLQLELEGENGQISHPYRILLKLVNDLPGIDTTKLMLALEAKNDSEREYNRIIELSELDLEDIVAFTNTTESMAANAVKILPAIAEQLNDIQRVAAKAFPYGNLIITEDEINAEDYYEAPTKERAAFNSVSAKDIAKDPVLKNISSVSIDLSSAIKTRQRRLAQHQEIVRKLAEKHEEFGYSIYEGKFDCLGRKADQVLLYEVKTILDSNSDQEKQTIKGIGQLKFYNFSVVQNQMGLEATKEILVYSQKPNDNYIKFCSAEDIYVLWLAADGKFFIHDEASDSTKDFNPDCLT